MIEHLVGQTFGRWTVERVAPKRYEKTYWYCRCACGTLKSVSAQFLKQGRSRSCGCLRRELVGRMFRKHGASNASGRATPEYLAWTSMHARCSNPRQPGWKNYGGRGIHVVDEWATFAHFLRDMGPRPTSSHSMDRIDNDGPYAPWNCRWATRTVQRANSRPPQLRERARCGHPFTIRYGERRCWLCRDEYERQHR